MLFQQFQHTPLSFLNRRWQVHRAACKVARCHAKPEETRIAVIGGGFAGLATIYHVLQNIKVPASVHLYEAYGLGAGGSGAAAGLLHAYSPKGKLLWRGEEAMRDALRLVEAAEEAAKQADVHAVESQFVWRNGIVRVAANAKQAETLAAAVQKQGDGTDLAALKASDLQQLVSGVQLPTDLQTPNTHSSKTQSSSSDTDSDDVHSDIAVHFAHSDDVDSSAQDALAAHASTGSEGNSGADAADSASTELQKGSRKRKRSKQTDGQTHGQTDRRTDGQTDCVGLLVKNGVVLQPDKYIRALWLACQHAAQQNSVTLQLHSQAVSSLSDLHAQATKQGAPYSNIVVAAGAAAGMLPEIGDSLPLQLCQGYTLNLQPHWASGPPQQPPQTPPQVPPQGPPQTGSLYPQGAPSLLGSPYLASHGANRLVLGATKQYGYTSEQAFGECARGTLPHDGNGVLEATKQLLPAALASLWGPLQEWTVASARSGVRALPPRSTEGALPLLGRLHNPKWQHLADPQGPSRGPMDPPAAPGGPAQTVLSSGSTVAAGISSESDATVGVSDAQQTQQLLPNVWLVAGLGARGLVYHSMLGKLTALAVLSGDEDVIPVELRRWQQTDRK